MLYGLDMFHSAVMPALSQPFVLAYIDPGTGSYIIQVLIAGLLGGLLAVKMFWRRMAGWFQALRGGRRKQ